MKRDCSPFKDNLRSHAFVSANYTDSDCKGFVALQAYCHLARIYTERQLTFDSDALNAFSGVLEMLRGPAKLVAVHNVSGLPFVPSIEDCRSQQASIFVAFSWANLGATLTRREEFPSWTWAGWQGRIGWRLGLNLSDGHEIVSFLQDVLFCSEDAEFAPPYGQNAQDKLDSVRAIKFEAPVVPRSAFEVDPMDSIAPLPDYLGVVLWGIKTYLNQSLGTADHVYEQIDKGVWTCFLLGGSPDLIEPSYCILIVEWQDGERAVRKTDVSLFGVIPDQEALERRTVKLI